MAEYSRRAHDTLKVSSNLFFVSLPFIPDFIQVWDLSRWAFAVNQNTPYMMWNKFMLPGDGLNLIYNQSLAPNISMNYQDSYPNGITPLINNGSVEYGPPLQIASISKANPAQVTCLNPHNLNTGDIVILEGLYASGSTTTGMQQIAGIPFAITRAGSSIFSIDWDTNQPNYAQITGSPAGCNYRVMVHPYSWSVGNNIISNIVNGTSTTITTTSFHNMFVGQEVAIRVPYICYSKWNTSKLQLSSNSLKNNYVARGIIMINGSSYSNNR